MNRTRSAVAAARGSCVTITVVWPSLSTASRSSASTAAPAPESRLPVGSSANSTVGLAISARAIATRCCWPPDSSAGLWPRRSVRPTRSMQRVDLGTGRLHPGDRERQRDVLLRRQRRQQVERLEHEPDVLAAQARERAVGHRGDLLAADPDRPGRRPVEPGEQVHERGLAGAGRAHDGRELAGGDVERDAAQGVDGGVAVAVAAGDGGRRDGGGRGGCEQSGHGFLGWGFRRSPRRRSGRRRRRGRRP